MSFRSIVLLCVGFLFCASLTPRSAFGVGPYDSTISASKLAEVTNTSTMPALELIDFSKMHAGEALQLTNPLACDSFGATSLLEQMPFVDNPLLRWPSCLNTKVCRWPLLCLYLWSLGLSCSVNLTIVGTLLDPFQAQGVEGGMPVRHEEGDAGRLNLAAVFGWRD